MVNADHPLWHLRSRLFGDWPGIAIEFSRYVYREYGVTESRDTFHIIADTIQEEWLSNQLDSLESAQELALHSRVNHQGTTLHIPMIDFVNAISFQEIHTRLRHISEMLGQNPWLYSSGRSLHGYYFLLIDETLWHRFLGDLLLCNSRGDFPSEIVDSRWVGHSLAHGFSALRLSQNTSRHRTLPHLLNTENSLEEIAQK